MFGLPATSLGRISVIVFFVGIVLIALTSVFESDSLTVGPLNVVGAISFLVLLTAAVTGAIAMIRDRERSWLVWLSAGLPAVVIAFELVSLAIGE